MRSWLAATGCLGFWVACGGEDAREMECAGRDEEGNVTLCRPDGAIQLETPAFPVAVGEEVQNCYFFRIDEETWVSRVEVLQNDGTHHMNMFRVNTVVGLGTEADLAAGKVEGGECWTSGNWADWPLVINSQESRPDAVNATDPETAGGHFDWTLPDGVAHRFAAGEWIMLQTHYVNVGAGDQLTPSGTGKVLANFYTVDADAVTAELGTAFATNQSICVCPEEPVTFEATCQLSQGDERVTIVGANGHFHSRGDLFTISTIDLAGGAIAEPFYESEVWDDPPMARDLAVEVPAGGGVHYACSYHLEAGECGSETRSANAECSSDDPCCMTFGGHVENQEHCNIFVYYYPKTRDVGCF